MNYPLKLSDQFVQLVLFPIVVEELFALFGGFRSVHLLRYHSPISPRVFEANLKSFDLFIGPSYGIGGFCLLFDHRGCAISQLSNSSSQSCETSRATLFGVV